MVVTHRLRRTTDLRRRNAGPQTRAAPTQLTAPVRYDENDLNDKRDRADTSVAKASNRRNAEGQANAPTDGPPHCPKGRAAAAE